MNIQRPVWPPQAKLIVSILVLALLVYLISRFSVVIAPLILAIILAYILSPVVTQFQMRLRLPRNWATFLTYLILIISVAALLVLIVPPLASQMTVLNIDIQQLIQQAEELLGRKFNVFGSEINGTLIVQQIINAFRNLLEPVVGQTLAFVVDVITSVVWLIFILVVSFYLIKDGDKLSKWFESLPPPEFLPDYTNLRERINGIWASFFRGQLILAFVVATMFTIAGLILGLPFALAMGILAGLLEFLPSIGHAIWLLTAAILAFLLGSTWIPLPNWTFALIIIGLHLFYQQFDLNYLIPRIIGHSVHLPPLVIILGIVAGAAMAGVLGIVLAAPTIASARVIARYIYANLFDMDPFPTAKVSSPSMSNPSSKDTE
jgi:predicted PurR-regulated permease PerM